jgi:LAO/AO transport system kinase
MTYVKSLRKGGKLDSLANKILQGNRLALSRLISHIENNAPDHQSELDILFPYTGKAHIIGVTGPSGVGKSTLVNRLAEILSNNKENSSLQKVGIIAVDPSSPFSGGALLGDRVRMNALTNNPNIFIRSMASRGALGGIANAVDGAVLGMDAAGFGVIIIETVGAGQSEVEVARLAHTTIVVEAPGLGDEIQAAKAGILEVADILVVNKYDKHGADSTARTLQAMLTLGKELREQINDITLINWDVPVLKTSALNRDGIDFLAEQVLAHRAYLIKSGEWETRSLARLKTLLEKLIKESLFEIWSSPNNKMEEMLTLAAEKEMSPYQIVKNYLK